MSKLSIFDNYHDSKVKSKKKMLYWVAKKREKKYTQYKDNESDNNFVQTRRRFSPLLFSPQQKDYPFHASISNNTVKKSKPCAVFSKTKQSERTNK